MAAGLETIREIAERVASSHGVEVWDVELRGSGKGRMLRISIDKAEGVTHEDCATYSREISTILDVEDAVPGAAYVLEVSSPGLDRSLRRHGDYVRFQGSLVKLSTFDPVNNNRHFEGRLKAVNESQLTLELDAASKKKQKQQGAGEVTIAFSNVEKANLVPEI